MKKLLITTALLASLSNQAYAVAEKGCCNSCKKHSPIYLRIDLLGNKFHKSQMNSVTYKHQNYSYGVDFGLGYYVTERLRAEAVYNHIFITKFKSHSLVKDKVDTKALFVRAMFDVVSFDRFKAFVGAGAGGARLSHKLIGLTAKPSESGKKNTFAYSFHAGASMKVVDGVMLDAAWSMRNYGKTGSVKSVDNTKTKLRAQVVSIGLRFDV